MLLPEVVLWQVLRKRPGGYKFRRQHPAGSYILDFFCARTRLAVEVDGEAHSRDDRPARDERRDAWLKVQGVRVLRVAAVDVLHDLDAVVRSIVATVDDACGKLPLHQPAAGPPPLAGEE